MHDQINSVTNSHLYNLVWGPKTRAMNWPMYHVNGCKFHTTEWEGKRKLTTLEFMLGKILEIEKMTSME